MNKIKPMTLYESCDSTGELRLKDLFSRKNHLCGKSNLDIDDITYLCARGGWPEAIKCDKKTSLRIPFKYYRKITNFDISEIDGVKRSSKRAKALMKSYAKSIGTQKSIESIKNGMLTSKKDTLTPDTVASYLKALNKLGVTDEVEAWKPILKSTTAIRTSKTRYFVDSSLAVAALNMTPTDLINNLKIFEPIFENLCVRDLRVYTESLGGTIYHYRDKTSLECDIVAHLKARVYGLIEVKLGGDKLIEEGVKTLNKLESKINTDKMNKPAFKMVLIATGTYAYQREDGIYVVPIGALKD